jgi:glycine/D-amino acid oxidase-like deaminating enzyme
VRLADGTVLGGDRVVVAAGPWSRELLPAGLSGDLTLYRQTMLSYTPPAGPAWARTPAILGLGAGHDAWLMPPVAGTPARLSAASACRAVPEMTDRAAPGEWRDHLIRRFGALLADFDPAAVTGAADGYYLADTAGGGPLLAGLGDGTVWAYAACGGMSFKLAPLIARALADRAVGRPPRPAGLDSIDRPRQFAAAAATAAANDGGPSRPGSQFRPRRRAL